ncbi:MAG: MbcA/ParS/Xre antitoxin family protein [Hydrococcus sp. Prado102]|jgi:hypothetical protein|nr:MbcA/ParS/Xre antitoxin family protein [Hydrococcus sp. Prado102]
MTKTIERQEKLPRTKVKPGEVILEAVYDLIQQESPKTLESMGKQLQRITHPPATPEEEEQLALELQEREYSPSQKLQLNFLSLLHSYQHRRQLLAETITSEEVARLLGCKSRQTPLDRVKNNTLVAVLDNGKWRYPLWQFDPEGADGVVKGLPEVLKVLQVSNLAKVSWLTRPNPILDGLTPLDALKRGIVDRVVAEARGVGIY